MAMMGMTDQSEVPRSCHTCRLTAAGIARPEAHRFAVGVAAPAGFVPAAALRPVASCRVGEDAEAGVRCGVRFRGRDAGCPAPPAQIRTCALTYGSYLRWLTAKRVCGHGWTMRRRGQSSPQRSPSRSQRRSFWDRARRVLNQILRADPRNSGGSRSWSVPRSVKPPLSTFPSQRPVVITSRACACAAPTQSSSASGSSASSPACVPTRTVPSWSSGSSA